MDKLSLSDEELEVWLKKLNDYFYDLVFKDPWLSLVFAHVDQTFITSQQVDFMLAAMGGPKRYTGRNPDIAHPHIFINEEMWQLREKLLNETFSKLEAPKEISQLWLKIDHAFKNKIVMNSPDQCRPRYAIDEFIIIAKPKILIK